MFITVCEDPPKMFFPFNKGLSLSPLFHTYIVRPGPQVLEQKPRSEGAEPVEALIPSQSICLQQVLLLSMNGFILMKFVLRQAKHELADVQGVRNSTRFQRNAVWCPRWSVKMEECRSRSGDFITEPSVVRILSCAICWSRSRVGH